MSKGLRLFLVRQFASGAASLWYPRRGAATPNVAPVSARRSFKRVGASIDEIHKATEVIRDGDRRIEAVERSVNDLYRKIGRPGGEMADGDSFERKSAIIHCHDRRALTIPEGR